MRSLYLELRLLPKTEPGEIMTMNFPDGTVYEFRAQEVVDGGDYQRMLLERRGTVDQSDMTIVWD